VTWFVHAAQAAGTLAMIEEKSRERKGETIDPETHKEILNAVRAPEVLRLNADHSLGAYLDEQARQRKISAAEAEANPYRNALRSALTGKAIEMVDLRADHPYSLSPGDCLVLASDGLGTLEGDEIGDILYANKDETPEIVADRLIAAVLAKKDPDQDNTTVLVLQIAEDTAPDEAPTRIVRAEPLAAAMIATEEESGVETTQRIVQPPMIYDLIRRHRSLVFGAGMGLMFLVGWLLRAWLG